MAGYTQQQADELRAAIARGATRVSYSNGSSRQEITYASLSEMRALLADIERRIAAASSKKRPARFSFTTFSR